jgi:hypothetical protein
MGLTLTLAHYQDINTPKTINTAERLVNCTGATRKPRRLGTGSTVL